MIRLREAVAAAATVCVVLIGALPVVLPRALGAQENLGKTYDMKTTIIFQGSSKADARLDTISHLKHIALLGNKRLETPDDPPRGDGRTMPFAYMIFLNGDEENIMVMPGVRSYTRHRRNVPPPPKLSPQELARFKAFMSAESKNIAIDVKNLGAGPVIDGHPTIYYRITERRDVESQMDGNESKQHVEVTTDKYYATDLDWFTHSAKADSMPANSMDATYADEYNAKVASMYPGRPIKTVKRDSTVTRGRGEGTRVTINIEEYTNFKSTQIDPSLFEPPAGFQEQQPDERRR